MTPESILDHHDRAALWPPGAGADGADLPAAYQTALAVLALREARGERRRGWKVGFTNRTIWARYQVFAPIWGPVWEHTLVRAGERVELGPLCQPRIEPEAVFGLRRAPSEGCDLDELFDALDWVAPGFEIVHCHLPDWKFTAAQTVADAALHGRLLVGSQVPVSALASDAAALHARLAQARVDLRRDGVLVESGAGAQVLDSPLRALLHFVRELRGCPGAPALRPGDIVTTGTWTDAWPVSAGQHWTATFDALLPPLGIDFG